MTPLPSSDANDRRPIRAGFTIPIDIVVAPGRALLKIAQTGEWIPAFAVIAACGLGTIALAAAPLAHIAALAKTHDGPSQNDIVWQLVFELLFVPLLVSMLVATVIAGIARFKDPKAPYGRFFSLALNCLIPSALGNVLHAAVAALRPAMTSFRAYDTALPDSLGVFAAPGNDREFGFLVHFGIFDAWSFVLIGYGISLFTKLRFSTSLFIAAALYFLYVLAYN